MPVEVAVNTPLAEALQTIVLPKLVDVGWSTGMQDDTLSEYIILMLANGKSQEQIASELSNDLLDLGPNDQGAVDFARWLFEQVEILNAQINGGTSAPVGNGDAMQQTATEPYASVENNDSEMREAGDGQGPGVPTGPKFMRNGSANPKLNKRMVGQLNKNMDRSGDSALHRIRGGGGVGRINSHASRDPPKGPRSQQIQRGIAAGNGRGIPPMQQQMPMGPMGGPASPYPVVMGAQQMQQMMAMFEEQARMMAQLTGTGMVPPFPQQGMPPQGQPQGRSMFDRVENRPHRGRGDRFQDRGRQQHPHGQQQKSHKEDVAMGEDAPMKSPVDGEGGEGKDPSMTLCHFNLACTKPDCPFAHQSPAARPGVTIDMSDECSYGVACTNPKCVGRHPSPGKKIAHQSQMDCKFGSYCTKFPNCPFRHVRECRNGADCTTEGCTFFHNPTKCKFNPCLNPQCPFKHADGQKRGAFDDKVWKAEDDKKEHVSERKFVDDEGGEEELIIPGTQNVEVETQIIT
ncbi:hypothetical protein EJ06DRAFT_536772 [Trichodelitschia bisporula]|uniref:Nab2-like CCCH zinc finger domain-containing protein n=1 Tax=Trichodelitschia bisporula TaxID=703511 RepID=A0A6G1I202_9PEZI|nr:hypothetical protein EJ06DRAFT_536772 [Trichodelitschia bisporula]